MYVREKLNGQRYLDKNIEVDAVVDLGNKNILVVEIKFSILSEKEKQQIPFSFKKTVERQMKYVECHF